MVNSRQKGKRGELDLCSALKEVMGWSAKRSKQYCGDAGDSDVVVEEAPDLFVECKLVQALNLTAVMKIAVQQAGGMIPAVFHRRDREEWLVTIRLADLERFSRRVAESTGTRQAPREAPSPRGSTSCQSPG